MQIKNIVLYKNDNLKPRILPFEIGKVNIITGESSTGKTALIDIIDYCLGSSFHVKGSKIRENVRWFAITIEFSDSQIFIARQNPVFLKLKTTNDIYFLYEDSVFIPKFNDLTNNSNTNALNKFISNKLNFHDNLHVADNNTRDSLEATFRHSRLFSFQPQDVIAQHKYIFFNQDESFMPQAIKDTLPYILGAIKEDELFIQQQISIKRKALNRYIRDRNIKRSIQSQSVKQLNTLIEEAKELELINKNIITANDDEAIRELKKLSLGGNVIKHAFVENGQLTQLIEKRTIKKKELTFIENEIKAVRDFTSNATTFKNETIIQHNRLLSIGLYKEPSNKEYWNSLTGYESDQLAPSIQSMNASLLELKNSLQFTEKEKPKVQKILTELDDKKNIILEEISKIKESIANIYKQSKELSGIKSLNIRKGVVLGRVSLFLESLDTTVQGSSLNINIEKLEKEIQELESKVSKEEKENKINAILNKINILMSSWSKQLDWEYTSCNLRFDIKKLTVFADSDDKSESLQQMGSGANWLACHIFIHLALHEHFIDKKRPVANFIIFDQPTQVHYPTGYKEKSGKIVKSDDEKADEKMFAFMFKIAKKLSPDLQIIITDHANFNNNDFKNAIVEEWRNGKKLVPIGWLS